MRPIVFTLLLICPFLSLSAQPSSSPAAEVRAAINELFDAMRQSDSAAVARLFLPEARLQSALQGEDGSFSVRETPISSFVSSIGRTPAGALDEQLGGMEIRIDGPLATAWTPYTFVLNGKVSHCGTNAFQLVRTADGWRILQVTDTRQRNGCDRPDYTAALDSLISRWHEAAATADEEVFFGSMLNEGIYIGTDASELWTAGEMAEWAAPYFERDTAWAFTPYDRHLYFDESGTTAWWDELLETWMGVCRGSGVAVRNEQGEWKLAHYHLSVTIPNEKIQDFIKLNETDR